MTAQEAFEAWWKTKRLPGLSGQTVLLKDVWLAACQYQREEDAKLALNAPSMNLKGGNYGGPSMCEYSCSSVIATAIREDGRTSHTYCVEEKLRKNIRKNHGIH